MGAASVHGRICPIERLHAREVEETGENKLPTSSSFVYTLRHSTLAGKE